MRRLRTFLGKLRHVKGRIDLRYEWRRRIKGEPALPATELKNILVICHGNVCRSPFAEHLLAERLPGCVVRSGGLWTKPGSPAEPGAIRMARNWSVELDQHRSHCLEDDDIEWADLIIGMQGHHLGLLVERFPAAAGKGRLLGDFLAEAPHAILDPWSLPDEVFAQIFEKIRVSSDCLARRIQEAAS